MYRIWLAIIFAATFGLGEPPLSLKIDYERGSFVLQNLKWSANGLPWFEGIVLNKTGADWKEVFFSIAVTGNDGTPDFFLVPITLGLRNGDTNTFTVSRSYSKSLMPLRSATGRFLKGIERTAEKGRVYSGPIALQSDCITDVASLSDLSGLALRKKATELVQYGCMETVQGAFVMTSAKSIFVPPTGPKKVEFIEAALSIGDPSHRTLKNGWIRADRIVPGEAEIWVNRTNPDLLK